MKKIGLLLAVAVIGVCVFGCTADKNGGKENESSSTYVSEDAVQETNQETESKVADNKVDKAEPLHKVEVITVVPTDMFDLYCSKDADLSNKIRGYITGFTANEMLIEEIKIVDDNSSPMGISTEWVGEKTLKLADEVEVWGLYTTTGNCYIQIPLEDIDNYEAMTCRGQWSFYANVEGKICMIVQNYLP